MSLQLSEIIIQIVIPIMFILIFMALIIVLTFQNVNQKWHLPFLYSAYIVAIFTFAIMVGYVILSELNWTGRFLLKLYEPINTIIAISLFIQHYEAMYSRRPPLKRLIIPIGSIAMGVLLYLMYLFDFLTFSVSYGILTFISSIILLYFSSFALFVTYRNQKYSDEKPIKIEYYAHYINSFTGVFLFIVCLEFLTGFITISELILYVPICYTPSLVACLIFILNYILNPNYIYGIPYPIHIVTIYNDNSVPIYNRFTTTPMEASRFIDHKELSEVFSSVSQYVKSIGSNQKSLNSINFSELKVIFRQIQNTDHMIVVVSSYSSYYLIRSIDKLATNLDQNMFDNWTELHKMDYFEQIDETLSTLFPYMKLLDTDAKARERVFKNIIGHSETRSETKINALLHLLEILLIEYQTSGNKEIINDIYDYLDDLNDFITENELYKLQIDINLLYANIELLSHNITEANNRWNKAIELAKKYRPGNEKVIVEHKNRIINLVKENPIIEISSEEKAKMIQKLDVMSYIEKAKSSLEKS